MANILQRIYVDTSVIGGCLDEEFAAASEKFMDMAGNGAFRVLISEITLAELRRAPVEVQRLLERFPQRFAEDLPITDESLALRNAYLAAGVVGPTHLNDAHHVALASVARADMIVSWSFKHIVHFEKIRGFNAVNLREGYPMIAIYSPLEIV